MQRYLTAWRGSRPVAGAYTYTRIGDRPTLQERDSNIPPLAELLLEVTRIREMQSHAVRAGQIESGSLDCALASALKKRGAY